MYSFFDHHLRPPQPQAGLRTYCLRFHYSLFLMQVSVQITRRHMWLNIIIDLPCCSEVIYFAYADHLRFIYLYTSLTGSTTGGRRCSMRTVLRDDKTPRAPIEHRRPIANVVQHCRGRMQAALCVSVLATPVWRAACMMSSTYTTLRTLLCS